MSGIRPVVALQRLTQKSLSMEVLFNLKKIELKGAMVNFGQPGKLFVQVVRGPQTWRSKTYDFDAQTRTIELLHDQFKRKSGLYFTKEGVELKKATFSFYKVVEEGVEEVICSSEINVSHLIGIDLLDRTIQVTQKGIKTLTISGWVCPEEEDREFIEEYLTKAHEEDNIPPLQITEEQRKRLVHDMFHPHQEKEHQIQEQFNSLEEQEKLLDDRIYQMNLTIIQLEKQNAKLQEKAATDETAILDYMKMERQQAFITEKLSEIATDCVTFRDYKESEFDGVYDDYSQLQM